MKPTYVVWTVFMGKDTISMQVYVINQETHEVHTVWSDLITARRVCEDLNKMPRIVKTWL